MFLRTDRIKGLFINWMPLYLNPGEDVRLDYLFSSCEFMVLFQHHLIFFFFFSSFFCYLCLISSFMLDLFSVHETIIKSNQLLLSLMLTALQCFSFKLTYVLTWDVLVSACQSVLLKQLEAMQ